MSGRDVGAPDPRIERIREHALLFDTTTQAVVATTPEGVIAYWNDVAAHLYGWTMAEVLGRDIVDITPAVLVRTDAADIMTKLREGKRWSGEFRVRRRDGVEFAAYVQDFPVRDEHGELIGIIGLSRPL